MENINISQDIIYLLIFICILIIPKIFLRYKVPSGITALGLGSLSAIVDPSLIDNDLFKFLAQIGITSLFLFAGLEVDSKDLGEKKSYLVKYLLKYSSVFLIISSVISYLFDLEYKYALLIGLGILTPSAGFILSSMHSYDINEKDETWIKSKAISKEIVSIAILFLVMQYDNPKMLVINIALFASCYLILPKLIKLFIKKIAPFAPNTEISFLVTLSLLLGVVTKELGTYYIVGAFLVGLIGNKFKFQIFAEGEEALFRSLSSFFSVFLPFYFFQVGLGIDFELFDQQTFQYGVIAFFIFIPLRFFLIQFGFLTLSNENLKNYYKISLTLMPTLVFGLIIANIISTQKPEYNKYAYALIIYTILSSILPSAISLITTRVLKKSDISY